MSAADLARSRSKAGRRIFVARAGNVYDVTDFADRHPGGKQLLMDNNEKDVEAVMQNPQSHAHSKAAYAILEKYFVGTVESLRQQAGNLPGSITRLEEYYKNDIVDWSKPMLGQVELLGDRYFDWVHQQVDRPIRLFKSDFAEMMTKAHWWFVPVTWIPVVLFFLWLSVRNLSEVQGVWPSNALGVQHGPTSVPAIFALGIFTWTFLEYAIHRWLFHLRPPADWPFLIRLHFSLHGQHHKSPMDPMRLVFPPLPGSAFGLLFYLVSVSIFPKGLAYGLFAGTVMGYILYDLTHYYLHHGGQPSVGYFQRLKTYHANHHYEHQQLGFGISSKMWDYPFGTIIPDDEEVKKQPS